MRILTTSERNAYRMDVYKEYIEKGRTLNYTQEWAHALENASTVHRVTRLQALQTQMRQQVETAHAAYDKGLADTAKDIFTEGYYRNIYEVQKGYGQGNSFTQLDTAKVEQVIAKPWTPDSKTFSDKIWQDKDKLLHNLNTKLTQAFIRGDDVRKLAKDLADTCGVSKANAMRLIHTEAAFFSAAAKLESYKALGVKQYQIVATLDTRTSDICQSMDGKVFDIGQYEPGITANPFHPWCRSTTAPYFEDETGERVARGGDGKAYHVPGDMTYKQWHKKYVDGNTDVSTIGEGSDSDEYTYDMPTDPKSEISESSLLKNPSGSGTLSIGGSNMINTGASGAIPRADIRRQTQHAKLFYEEVRKRKGDVAAIAKNTGFSIGDIEKIKKHVFFNKYDLGDEALSCFDPDYDMAVSWQRLIEGKAIQEMDIVMLNHELMEYGLMSEKGLNYREAHKLTEKIYDYAKYVRELNEKEGLL